MSAPLADTVRGAYLQGIAEIRLQPRPIPHPASVTDSGPVMVTGIDLERGSLEAARMWRLAQSDHGHASFYGADHIRRMRAYWIGRRRGSRLEL